MAYRKFAADYLFTGNEMLGSKAVLITDENGKVYDIADVDEVSDGVERYNGILSPGFVNCHCHLELSHMKAAIPPGSGMVNFLLTVMRQRTAAEEIIQESIIYNERYMVEKGIVAVADICNTDHTIPVKMISTIYFHNLIEAAGVLDAHAELRFTQAQGFLDQFVANFAGSSIVPHAPYSVSNKLIDLINKSDPHSLLSIHNQESEAESMFFENGTGEFLELYKALGIDVSQIKAGDKSSLKHFTQQVSKTHSLMLVHNVHTTRNEWKWAADAQAQLPELWWCLCPNANLYINNKMPDVPMFAERSGQVVLGTDSLASNNQLNILEEMKTIQSHYPNISTETLLTWATMNGARALRINTKFGSFEKGKQPGVVIIHGGKVSNLEGTVSRRIL